MKSSNKYKWLEVRMARRELQADVNAAYENGQRVHIAFPARLIINGQEVARVRPKFGRRYTSILTDSNIS